MLDFLDFCMSNKQKGHLAIMLVVVLYTASSVTISEALESSKSAFFASYVSSSLFSLFLFLYGWNQREVEGTIFHAIRERLSNSSVGGKRSGIYQIQSSESTSKGLDHSNGNNADVYSQNINATQTELIGNSSFVEVKIYAESVTSLASSSVSASAIKNKNDKGDKLDFRQHLWIASFFSVLYFAGNYLQYLAFQYTSVGNATILMSTSAFFTLILGAMLKLERITVFKSIGILLGLVGAVLINLRKIKGDDGDGGDDEQASSEHDSRHPMALWGNICALASALVYACYSNYTKKMCPDESKLDSYLFFGLVGVISMLFFWPFFFLVVHLGLDLDPRTMDSHTLTLILCNAIFFSVLPMYLWYVCMAYTSATVTAVAMTLLAPASLIVEVIIKPELRNRPWYEWLAVLIVTFAFCLFNYSDLYPKRDLTFSQLGCGIGGRRERERGRERERERNDQDIVRDLEDFDIDANVDSQCSNIPLQESSSSTLP